ncbi:MAG: tyrosine-type recombinase/integrase [Anaerolineales bacterium]
MKGVSGETLPAGRALSSGEIAGLIDACADDLSPAGARDAAVIAVLYACGLRRSEVHGLDLADVDLTAGSLTVRRGKGRKDRSVPIASGGISALRDWITVRGSLPGPLFGPIDKGGKVSAERMSSQAIYNLLQKRAAQAAVTNLSPHDFRRSMISHLLDAGADLVVVSRLAGHASVTTTSRYDRRGEEAKCKAVELLHVPYHPRPRLERRPSLRE